MNLSTPVNEIAGIGTSYADRLKKLGIEKIEDFLLYLPRRWDDFSNIIPISGVRGGESVSIHGKISEIFNRKSINGKNITEAVIDDGTGQIKVIWFNQPFLINSLKEGDEVYLAGKVDWNMGKFSLVSPVYEKLGDDEGEENLSHTGRIVPVYPETDGITSKWLRNKIKPMMKYIYSIKDYLPEEIKKEQGLVDFPAAIRQMHFPQDYAQLKKAKERLDFDEMFLLQLAVLNSKKHLEEEKSIAIPFNENLIKKFVQDIGFELTNAQRKAAWEIIKDLSIPHPMNRLLQGDVGSGKTVVAAIVMANVAASDAQSILLCPTEILAKQHFGKIRQMVD